MADTSATIIAASLSDDELKKSVNKLVSYFDDQMKIMAVSANITVDSIEKKLKSLGNIKIDSGGSADGGSSKRTSKQKEEEAQVKATTQAYKEQAATFDQQAAAVKRSSRGVGSGLKKELDEASNSYENLIQKLQRTITHFDVSPIQSLRMRQHELEAGMRTASNEAAKAKKDVDELNAAITNYRSTLETLPKNQQGFSNRQSIQKEINDLITLRDAASAEQQKWENAGRQLASQYEVVKSEIRQIGQALISAEESEKRVTTEIDKQLQKINEISSRKTATQAYREAISMETGSLEKAESKLAVLKTLKEKVLNTDLLSKKDTESLASWITYTTSLVERMRSKSSKGAKENEDAIRRTAEAEKRWAENIISRGQIAQETSRKIIQMLNNEAQAGGSGIMGMLKIDGKDVNAVRELEKAIKDMQMQYNQMSDMDKESAIGRALKRDIENAQKASGVVSAYNKMALGFNNDTNNSETAKIRNYEILKNILKELTNQYNQISIAEIKAGNANHIINSIQRTNREIQQLQAIMNRPTSFASAMKLSEKTLDDLHYKIRQLQSYKLGIELQNPNAANEIKQVDDAILKLQKDMDKYMGKTDGVIKSNNALGRSWNYMKNRLAFYFTVGASTQFIKNLVEVRSQYEMNERALGILINSAERGTQIFNELSQMALVSPYTLIELSNAAKQLTAYDIAAKDVVDTTRRLADMASAVGVPMERLTYALGQIKAYGYLNSRDARMFANAGIPLVRELSKYYSELEGKVVSVGDVYDRMKKKAIDFNSVMAVVTNMTDEGGKFFDFQAKMAGTLKVQLANLTLAWNNMLNDIGASEQGVLASGIAALKNLFLHWKDIEDTIRKVVVAFGLFKVAQFTALAFMGDLTSAMAWQTLVGKRLQTTFVSLASSIKTSSLAIGAAGAAFWMLLAEGIVTYMRNAEEVERLNQSISDGAKDAAKNLNEFLESAEIEQAKLSAQTGKLPKSEAEKTWDALREQIELSSASANDIIPKLLEISDLNSRLTLAFDLAERIKKANENLGDLNNTLDFTQDTILGGLFGEGVVEDIEDYNEHLAYTIEREEYFKKKNHSFWENAVMGIKVLFGDVKEDIGSSTNEAEDEIIRFSHNAAKAIKDNLGEEGLKDSVQINEAISRVLNSFEQQFPQIKGKGKALFETIFNDVMAQEFSGAVDKQAYYYKLFLERLKKDHASAFQGVTDDILKETHRWSSGQENAIKKTAEKVKTDLPLAAQNAIDQILNQLNNTDFKLRIVTEFATTKLDDVQKQFREKFIEKDVFGNILSEKDQTERQQKYGSLMIKNNESDLEYQERIKKEKQKQLDISKSEGDIISRNQGKTDAWSKAIVARATEAKKAADDTLSAINDIESGGYDFTTKKENAAARKAQKEAESELQKAFRDELQLIDRVRSQYKKLTDAGATDGKALAMVTNQFANSLAHVNNVLGKNNIPLFDISKFAGTDNPHALLDMLKLQLDSAKIAKNIKPEEIKELEVKYSDIKVDAEAYDLTKITKGLNNELDRLKEEYELAIALDADPELGSMFADWMGIDMSDLPRTASEYAEKATSILNKKLSELGSKTKLPNLLNITDDDMRAFEENKTFTDKQLELIKKAVEIARGYQRKETEERIKDWDKLLEKYAEYEVKVNKIHNDAVKERVTFAQQFGSEEDKSLALNLQTKILAATDPQEKQKLVQQLQELVKSIAGDDKTKVNLITSIDNSEQQRVAKTDFEQFQKSPEWITATGDLAGMTTKAIGYLISSIEKYKKTAKGLDPKQIKQINSALRNLHRQQRQGNPFLQIANAIDRAKERAEEFKPEMDAIMSDIIALEKEIGDGEATEEQEKHLKTLKDRWKELAEQGKVSATEYVEAINASIAAASQAIGMFADMAEALGGKHMTEAAQTIRDVTGILEKAGQGAATGAQIGGGWGALIGGVAGGLTGVITTFAEQWSGNKAITDSVKESEKAVRQLELTMKSLEHTSDDAFGAIVMGSKQSVKATKELQLAELRRQLTLEQSRSSKYKDEERISELQGQILDLEYEVKHATTEIVNDLLGISSHEDFFEGLISDMINAFKSGEDAMKVFSDKWAEMIDSMVVKMILGQVLQQWVNNLESGATKIVDKYTKKLSEQVAEQENFIQKMQSMDAFDITRYLYNNQRDLLDKIIKQIRAESPDDTNFLTGNIWSGEFFGDGMVQKIADVYLDMLKNGVGGLQDQISTKSLNATDELIDYYTKEGKVFGDQIKDIWPQLMEQFGYKYGQDAEAGLSALQQGIQGVTEDTAGAIEAYMNGVSQQVYYQSDIMTQIRDILLGGDADIQLGVQGQMLLQLQQSFQVQMAIQGILEGALTPSGQGFRVELLS